LMRVSNPNDAPPGVGTSYVADLIALYSPAIGDKKMVWQRLSGSINTSF